MSDAEAITASLSDPAAFVVVFDRHADAINRYLRRRVGTDVADELTSETFAQAFEHRRRFDPSRPNARPWLYGIAHNLLRRHYRDEEQSLRLDGRTAIESNGFRPDASYSSEQLARALAQLAPSERDVLLLVAWAELAYGEIAETLSIPVGTVRSRLHRGRARLRELLTRSADYEKERI